MGAVLTHGNLTANVLQCLHWNPSLSQGGRETVLVALPLSHSYGMTIGMNLGLATASRLVLMPRFDPGAVLDLVEQSRVTYFPGVPSMFEALLKSPDLRKYNLHSIKTCLSGGAPLPLEVQQDFEAVTGGRLIEGYGLAEASPVTHSNPYRAPRRVGSIGLPLPDTAVKVVDLHRPERELPPGAVGELCLKGPQVMQGYFNAPEETALVLRDGWLHTGDIVHLDEDGYAYIVDRKKDLIISGGYNIYPAEVQAVLQSHPRIAKAAVSSQRDPYKGEALRVLVTPEPGFFISEAEILKFCRENLAAYKIPHRIEIQ
jgi:long-chain acyl-CoA synthetase